MFKGHDCLCQVRFPVPSRLLPQGGRPGPHGAGETQDGRGDDEDGDHDE